MQIQLYADVLFFINFFMLYIIFFTTNTFVKIKASNKRILITSSITAITYIYTLIFIPFSELLSTFIIFAIMCSSILFCFKTNSITEFIKTFLLVNVISFCIGGSSIALFYYSNIFNILSNLGNVVEFNINNFSFKMLLIATSTTYLVLLLSLKCYKNIVVKKQVFYNLKLHNDGKDVLINSLLDTGNSLKEPISQKPVIIAEFLAIKDILPNCIKILFYENQENNLEKILEHLENSDGVDFRFIPFKSVGEQNGMLLAIKIEKMEILSTTANLDNKINNNNNSDKIVLSDVIVAICNFSLSKDNFYNSLLNPEMLK